MPRSVGGGSTPPPLTCWSTTVPVKPVARSPVDAAVQLRRWVDPLQMAGRTGLGRSVGQEPGRIDRVPVNVPGDDGGAYGRRHHGDHERKAAMGKFEYQGQGGERRLD